MIGIEKIEFARNGWRFLMTVLVTGGAGYIGSHIVAQLLERTVPVVVLDDFSTGSKSRIHDVPVLQVDLAAPTALEPVCEMLSAHSISAVIHLAARKRVDESNRRPWWYYEQNVGSVRTLLEALKRTDTRRLIFSSSAAVYGNQDSALIAESSTPAPLNPYGETKLVGEWMANAAKIEWGLDFVALRYFNVAGARSPLFADVEATNLIPTLVRDFEAGRAPQIFGNDYNTPDGTCIRDYIHVEDLAEAHLAALEHLRSGPSFSQTLNVGTGRGFSVLDVIDTFNKVTKAEVSPEVVERRAGDAACVVADTALIARELGWHSKRTLEDMVRSAWNSSAGKARSADRVSDGAQ